MDAQTPAPAQPHERSPRPGFRLLSRLRNFSRRLSCTSPPRPESSGNATRAAPESAQPSSQPVDEAPQSTPGQLNSSQAVQPPESDETRQIETQVASPPIPPDVPVIPLDDASPTPLPLSQSPAIRPRRTQSSSTRRPFRPSTLGRLRRKCHKCDSPFIFSEQECQECNHVICTKCPWDSAASLHTSILPPTLDPVAVPDPAPPTSNTTLPAPTETSTPAVILDAPPAPSTSPPPDLIPSTLADSASSSDDSSAQSEYDSDYPSLPFRRTANLQARTHKRPRMRVRHICHNCNGQFAVGVSGPAAACVTCQHDRCGECQRTPEKRVRVHREFEAEVVAIVRARLEGYGVRDVPAVVPVGTPTDTVEVIEA